MQCFRIVSHILKVPSVHTPNQFFDQYNCLTRILDLFNRRQQSVQAINSLPNEILCKIFEHLQGNVPLYFPPPSCEEMQFCNQWIQESTQVCRRWREVALGTPSLWRYVMLNKEIKCPGSFGMTYVQRSHPLKFELTFFYDSLSFMDPNKLKLLNDLCDTILQNRERVQAIHLTGDHGNPLYKLLDEELPAVQSVHPPWFPGENGFVPNVPFDPNPVPGNATPFSTESFLFKESSPIKKLSLSGFHARPPSIFHHLTHLSLRRWSTQYTSTVSVLDCLSACPLLEYIYLQGDPYSDSMPGSPRVSSKYGFQSIPMVHMKRIEFWMPLGRLMPAEFLRYLKIPAETTIVWPPSMTRPSSTIRTPPITQLPPPAFCNAISSVIFQCSTQEVFTISNSTLYVDMQYRLHANAEYMVASIPDFFHNIKSVILADVDRGLSTIFPSTDNSVTSPFGLSLMRLFDTYSCLEKLEVRCTTKSAQGLIKDFVRDYQDHQEKYTAIPRLSSVTFSLLVSDDAEEKVFDEVVAEAQRRGLGSMPFDLSIQRDGHPFVSTDISQRAMFKTAPPYYY